MSYKALYRKYRPQVFSEVVSQAAIIQTLQNQIISGKISHAYLFSGPRGTGKTTVARIFAKALNCENVVNGEPCLQCTNCQEIGESVSPDVIEIDAASNNGVDEIRDIREKVKFLPSGAKYKIYIIDEVHMLSQSAFNALLKTLEEPPKHVIFILATTEPQKLLATIISRCQRFDFKPINALDISMKLKSICEKEEVTISDDAINAIAEAAEGGMRDALSILDQVISYGNKDISVEDVNTIIGSISFDKMIELMNYINAKNVNFALDSVNEFVTTGKEASKVANAMLVFCRDLLLYKNIGDKNSNKYIFEKEKFQSLASQISVSKVLYYIDLLCDVQNRLRLSTTPNIYLEITIIKMCNVTDSELDILKRVSDLEEKVENGPVASPDGEGGFVDNEKLNLVDAKVNRVVTELNKLELHKLAPRLDDIEKKMEESEGASLPSDGSIQKAIEDIKFDIENLKNDHLVSTSLDDSGYDELKEEIEELKNNSQASVNTYDIDSKLNDLQKEIENLKERQVQTGFAPTTDFDDAPILEKINELENKVNRLSEDDNEEMGRAIHNLAVELNDIKEKIDGLSNSEGEEKAPNDNADLTDLIDTVEILKLEYEDLKKGSYTNQSEGTSNEDLSKLDEKYNYLYQNLQKLNQKIEDLSVKEDNKEEKVETIDSEDLNELKEKIQNIESKMYKFISESLSSTKQSAKPAKKPKGQIMLFGDDIIGIDDIDKQSREEVQFGDIQSEEEQNESYNEETQANEDFVQEKLDLESEEKEDSNLYEEEKETLEYAGEDTEPAPLVESDFAANVDVEELNANDNSEYEEDFEEKSEELEETQEQTIPAEVEEEAQEQEVQEQEVQEQEVQEDAPAEEKVEEVPTQEEPKEEKEEPNLFNFNFGNREKEKDDDSSYGDLFNFNAKPETNSNVQEEKKEEPVPVEPVQEEKPKVKDEIIEQRYDPERQESIVTKTNSMLVTREKQERDGIFDIEKSLLRHEKESYKAPVEQSEEKEEEQAEIIVGKQEEKKDKFAAYDIRDIEQILADSQNKECRNDCARVKNIWDSLLRGLAPNIVPLISTFAKGEIKAVGNKELIITYPNVSYCNQVMRPKFKKEALRVLLSKLGDSYNYIALPENIWQGIRNEYRNQYYTGTRRPKLSPLNIPGLNIISDSDEYETQEDRSYNKAIEMFGEDIVKR